MVSSSLYFIPSGSLNLNVQPPCRKPSAPPGSSITPSSEMNSVTTMRRIAVAPWLRGSYLQASNDAAPRSTRDLGRGGQARGVARAARAPARAERRAAGAPARPPSATRSATVARRGRARRAGRSRPSSTPTSGPPIGVEPWKATNHSDITRPRISGAELSCSVELPVDMKAMLPAPASASASSSSAQGGGERGERQRSPEAERGEHQRPQAGLAAGGDEQAADHGADAHRRRHEAEPGGADVQSRGRP